MSALSAFPPAPQEMVADPLVDAAVRQCDDLLSSPTVNLHVDKMQEFDVQSAALRGLASENNGAMENMKATIAGSRAEIIEAMRVEMQRATSEANLRQQELGQLADQTRVTVEALVSGLPFHAIRAVFGK